MGDRAFGHNGAAVHDVEAVANVETEVEMLLDQQDANPAFLAKLLGRVDDLLLVFLVVLVQRKPDAVPDNSS